MRGKLRARLGHHRVERAAHVRPEAVLVAVLALAVAGPAHHVVEGFHSGLRSRTAIRDVRRMRQRATMVTSAAVGRASGVVLTSAARRCRFGRPGRAAFADAWRGRSSLRRPVEGRPMHTATYRLFDRADRKWCAWKPSGERVRAECQERPRPDRPCRRRPGPHRRAVARRQRHGLPVRGRLRPARRRLARGRALPGPARACCCC